MRVKPVLLVGAGMGQHMIGFLLDSNHEPLTNP